MIVALVPFLLRPTSQSAMATIEIRATSLAQALPKLGEAYGVPMRATPAIGDEIAIFALKNAPLEETRARLAETFAAEWTVAGDGTLVLNRATNARAAEKRASDAKRRATIVSEFAALKGREAKAPVITRALMTHYRDLIEKSKRGEEVPDIELQPLTPAQRLLFDAILSLRPDDLIGAPRRLVFSNLPTPAQRPFPKNVAPDLARFETEDGLWTEFSEAVGDADPDADPSPPRGPATRLHLVVESTTFSVSFNLSGFDAAGREVLAADTGIDFNETTREDETEEVPSEKSLTPETTPHIYPASAGTKEFVSVLGFGTMFSSAPVKTTPGPETIRPYLDVVARDPLSFALSDVALEASRFTGRSVIVRASDEGIFSGIGVESGAPMHLPEAFGTSRVDLTHTGWLTALPDDPFRSSGEFFPRADLREALMLAFRDRTLSLETACRIAQLAPETGFDAPLGILPMRLGEARTFLNFRLLRIFAALGVDGRRSAATGVRFADLSEEVRRRLTELVFGADRISIDPETLTPDLAAAAEVALLREPTYVLPDGIPSEARVSVVTAPVAGLVRVDAASGNGRWQSLDAIATRVYQTRNPGLFPGEVVKSANSIVASDYRRADRDSTTLRVDLTAQHRLVAAHNGAEKVSGASFKLSALPEDLRTAFDAAMARAAERFRDAMPFEDPTGTPPP